MSKLTSKMANWNVGGPFENDVERAQVLYFNWLCNMVHVDDYIGKSWYILAKLLHNMEFYSVIHNDENRASHGAHLRQVWLSSLENEAEELGLGYPLCPQGALDGPCTILEMLVALALRIESEIMQDEDRGNRTAEWFWVMIRNMFRKYRLAEFGDDCITPKQNDIVHMVVTRMLDREYWADGHGGGLFPLDRNESGEDQREVEIWYQAQYWLQENYPECFN